MSPELQTLFTKWTAQATTVISKVAAGQPVTKEECVELAYLQEQLVLQLKQAAKP